MLPEEETQYCKGREDLAFQTCLIWMLELWFLKVEAKWNELDFISNVEGETASSL